jgi:DNA polymerase III alpha subunit
VSRRVYDLAKKAKLTPIIGLEAYFRDDNCPILTAAGVPKTVHDDFKDKGESFIEYNKYYHLTLHFRDAEAFETASRLLSKADTRRRRSTAPSTSPSSGGTTWRSWAAPTRSSPPAA